MDENLTTPINGRPVPYRVDILNTADLRFWEENPRVYAAVQGCPEFQGASPEQRQQIILGQMCKEESTAKAKEAMERHGGLQEAILVDYRSMVVIEGNSRLAAARQLAEKDEKHWGALECKCYNDITEEEKIALLNQMHIQGKTQWTPHAKACTYWRQKHDKGWTHGKIAEVNGGVNRTTVGREIGVIEEMIKNEDGDPRKYSWYKSLAEMKGLKEKFKEIPQLEGRVMEIVRNARSQRTEEANKNGATQFRDQLRTLIKKPHVLKKYAKGGLSLRKAAEAAKMSTVTERIRKAREALQAIHKEDIGRMSSGQLRDAKLALKRVRKEIDVVASLLESGNEGNE